MRVLADAELLAGLGERPLELAAPIGEHALDRPARPAVEWDQGVAQELRQSRSGGLTHHHDASVPSPER